MTEDRQQRVLVVGAGWDQAPIIIEAKRQGHFVVAADGNPAAYGLQFADKAIAVSTRDREGVLRVAREERVDAITYMITESPLYAIRYAADALGLPAPSHKSVEATVSKVRMREIYAAAGIPQPRFGRAATVGEALALAEELGFPLIMKSADVGGQLGLFKLEDLSQVADAFAVSRAESVGGQAILEEMLDGDEVNVVALITEGVVHEMTVSDRIKHPSMAFGVVMQHVYPTQQSAATVEAIRAMCQQMVEATEIRDAILFPQMIVTDRGPRVVEVGERIPGGVMKELFELATGYDLLKLQLALSFGRTIDPPAYRTGPGHPAVTVKFINGAPGPLRPGKVSRVLSRDDALAIEGIVDVQFYNDPTRPQEVRPLRNGRDRFYQVIAVGETRDQALARSEQAAACLDFLDEAGRSLRASPSQS